jgi:oxygen-independent coproporphyrinogen-3 oxidase
MDAPQDGPGSGLQEPPLALYVHMPWCVRKCPYCDFNSHAAEPDGPPFADYVARLLADLDQELLEPAARRPLASVFIGGGTPSLFPGPAIGALLDGIRARTSLEPDCEVTLEANPGAADSKRFAAYREAGVNRLSIGVQSLDDASLIRLGRIHDPHQARAAVAAARAAGFANLNLDLMFALPEQTLDQALADLDALLALEPEHVSYYQLTIEDKTAFHACPPPVPDGDLAADMGAAGRVRLEAAGYRQYEVSAYARPGHRCRHNLNYWRFGDYLGIGAGAHSKVTNLYPRSIRRRAKRCHPADYLLAAIESLASKERTLDAADRIFEFALNAFRLTDGFEQTLFESTTGLPWSSLAAGIETAERDGLLRLEDGWVRPTRLGRDFLDDLVCRFLPTATPKGSPALESSQVTRSSSRSRSSKPQAEAQRPTAPSITAAATDSGPLDPKSPLRQHLLSSHRRSVHEPVPCGRRSRHVDVRRRQVDAQRSGHDDMRQRWHGTGDHHRGVSDAATVG